MIITEPLSITDVITLFSAISIFLGCVIYPNGWDSDAVRKICGLTAGSYNPGVCELRWAYILAIVLIFDAAILAILAFVLAAKQARLLPEVYKEKGM